MRAALLSLALLVAAGGAARAQSYIPVDRKPGVGLAPRMQVKLLSREGGVRRYVVIFRKGDEAIGGLNDFARRYGVRSASLTAVGATSQALASWYDLARKAYLAIPVAEQAEVISMVGDIALSKGQPVVHTHGVLATRTGEARGGHLWELHVDPTLEVFVTATDTPLAKTHDEASGLELIDPAG